MTDFPIPSDILPLMESETSDNSKIQRIFALAGDKVLADGHLALSYEQRHTVDDIRSCRTINSGFNLEVCQTCGGNTLHYNSCGDRNCPICQGLKFIRRFLLHVLPRGFQKIRYYGYLNNRWRKDNLILLFNLQGYRQYIQQYKDMTKAEILFQVWGHDVSACPHCHARTLVCLYRTRGRPSSSIA